MALAFFSGELTEWGNIFFFLDFGSVSPLVVGAHALTRLPYPLPLLFYVLSPFLHNVFMNLPDLALFMDLSHYRPTQFSFNRLLACFQPPPLENTMYPLPELVLTLKGHFVFHFSPPSNQWKQKKQVIRENSHFTGESCQIVTPLRNLLN